MISIPTRFKIIGAETVAVGAFLLLTFVLNQSGTSSSRWLPRADTDLPIVGGALIFIGFEIFSLSSSTCPHMFLQISVDSPRPSHRPKNFLKAG